MKLHFPVLKEGHWHVVPKILPLGFEDWVDQVRAELLQTFTILGKLVRRKLEGGVGRNGDHHLRNSQWQLDFSFKESSLSILFCWVQFTWQFEFMERFKTHLYNSWDIWDVLHVLVHLVRFEDKAGGLMVQKELFRHASV